MEKIITRVVNSVPYIKGGTVELIGVFGDENFIANCARASTGSGLYFSDQEKTKEDNIKLVRRLYRDQHTSPLEMAEMAFLIKAPNFVVKQWLRHRTGNFSELSMRYKEISPEFYQPAIYRGQDERNKQSSSFNVIEIDQEIKDDIKKLEELSEKIYKKLIKQGVSREISRIYLLNSVFSTFIYKTDINNLIKFLKLRTAPDAQFEIRMYANVIKKLFGDRFPYLAIEALGWIWVKIK